MALKCVYLFFMKFMCLRSLYGRKASTVPPEFTTALEPVSLTEGARMVLKCTVTGTPDPTVQWFKDGRSVTYEEQIKTRNRSGMCSLTIPEARSSDSGEYSCRATNSDGDVTTQSTVHIKSNVQIEKAPPLDLPVFTLHPQGVSVMDGDSVHLQCRVAGSQEIIWYKGNAVVHDSSDFKYEASGDLHRLVIAEVFPEDSGVYKAEASNSTGTTSSSFTVQVDVPEDEPSGPVFLEFPLSQNVDESHPVTFTCSFDDIDTVSWMKDGREIADTGRFKFGADGNRRSFKIPAALATDTGVYAVEANNVKGNTLWTFTLNVIVSASPCADIDVLSLIRSVQ